MIRFLLRTLGFVLLAAAFAAMVVDGTRSIAGGRVLLSSLSETVGWLAGTPGGVVLGAFAGLPAPGRAAVAGLLAVPGWVVAGALGLMLLHAGRPPVAGTGFSGRRA